MTASATGIETWMWLLGLLYGAQPWCWRRVASYWPTRCKWAADTSGSDCSVQIGTPLVQASACMLDQVNRSRAAASAAWDNASGPATAVQGLHDLIGNTSLVLIKSLSEATGCQVRIRATC